MEKENIKIVFQHYIPQELITDFNKLGLSKKINAEIEISKLRKTAYNNFNGPDISDIIIYLEKHKLETAAEVGIMVGYDLLKGGIKLLWTGISKLAIKITTAGHEAQDKDKTITLKVTCDDKIIKVVFDGIADDAESEKIIDKAFEFLNSAQPHELFKKPNFVIEKSKPTITLVYNRITKQYEPINFEKNRQAVRDIEKSADENLSS